MRHAWTPKFKLLFIPYTVLLLLLQLREITWFKTCALNIAVLLSALIYDHVIVPPPLHPIVVGDRPVTVGIMFRPSRS